mgnify:CR=1 FL=1
MRVGRENGIVEAAGAAMVHLIGADLGEIEAEVAGIGEPQYRARQIYAGIYKRSYNS